MARTDLDTETERGIPLCSSVRFCAGALRTPQLECAEVGAARHPPRTYGTPTVQRELLLHSALTTVSHTLTAYPLAFVVLVTSDICLPVSLSQQPAI